MLPELTALYCNVGAAVAEREAFTFLLLFSELCVYVGHKPGFLHNEYRYSVSAWP
jgi:hypothetical protein